MDHFRGKTKLHGGSFGVLITKCSGPRAKTRSPTGYSDTLVPLLPSSVIFVSYLTSLSQLPDLEDKERKNTYLMVLFEDST